MVPRPAITLGLAVSLIVGACGASASPAPASQAPVSQAPVSGAPASQAAGPVHLVFVAGLGSSGQAIVQAQLATYQQAHPNVTVDFQAVDEANLLQKIQTLKGSGSQMDLLSINGDAFVDMVSLGLLMDITDKVNFYDRFKQDTFYKNYYEINGKRYSVPAGIGYYFTYFYNQALFDKYGLKPPTDFTGVQQVSDTLNAQGVLPFALPGKFNLAFSDFTHFTIDQTSGNNADQVTRDTVAGRTPFTDKVWVDSWNCAMRWVTANAIGKNYLSVDQTGADAAFAAGKAGITATGNWSFPTYLDAQKANPDQFKMGVMLPPLCPEAAAGTKPRVAIFPGNAYSVYAGSQHATEAIDLMDFLSSDANAEQWMKASSTNLTENVNASNPTTDPTQIQAEQWFDQGFVSPDWIMGITLFTKFQDEFVKVVQGKQSVDQGLANVEAYRVSIKDQLPTY
jgi:ABC-type glycerol-3-phosphate transport system substrate-binding protein